MAPIDLSMRLRDVLARYEALTDQLSQSDVVSDLGRLQDLAREQSGLEDVASMAREWLAIEKGIAEARVLIDESGGDREMEALAKEELASLETRREALQGKVVAELQPRDPNDQRSVGVESRAGTG